MCAFHIGSKYLALQLVIHSCWHHCNVMQASEAWSCLAERRKFNFRVEQSTKLPVMCRKFLRTERISPISDFFIWLEHPLVSVPPFRYVIIVFIWGNARIMKWARSNNCLLQWACQRNMQPEKLSASFFSYFSNCFIKATTSFVSIFLIVPLRSLTNGMEIGVHQTLRNTWARCISNRSVDIP